jgi:hypothetical protein
MRAKSLAIAALGASVLLASVRPGIAHDDPAGCTAVGIALTVALYRADGRTGLIGEASECERMIYRVRLAKAMPTGCAFSGGTLTLTTPDGVSHPIVTPVPCVGGDTADGRAKGGPVNCSPDVTAVESEPVEYTARPSDVRDGRLKAVARYDGGVVHDSENDTPGLSSTVDRTVLVTFCDDADPCTLDRCDPLLPAIAACSNRPACDDDDPTTIDACSVGRCTFTPIATSDRLTCGGSGR